MKTADGNRRPAVPSPEEMAAAVADIEAFLEAEAAFAAAGDGGPAPAGAGAGGEGALAPAGEARPAELMRQAADLRRGHWERQRRGAAEAASLHEAAAGARARGAPAARAAWGALEIEMGGRLLFLRPPGGPDPRGVPEGWWSPGGPAAPDAGPRGSRAAREGLRAPGRRREDPAAGTAPADGPAGRPGAVPAAAPSGAGAPDGAGSRRPAPGAAASPRPGV